MDNVTIKEKDAINLLENYTGKVFRIILNHSKTVEIMVVLFTVGQTGF